MQIFNTLMITKKDALILSKLRHNNNTNKWPWNYRIVDNLEVYFLSDTFKTNSPWLCYISFWLHCRSVQRRSTLLPVPVWQRTWNTWRVRWWGGPVVLGYKDTVSSPHESIVSLGAGTSMRRLHSVHRSGVFSRNIFVVSIIACYTIVWTIYRHFSLTQYYHACLSILCRLSFRFPAWMRFVECCPLLTHQSRINSTDCGRHSSCMQGKCFIYRYISEVQGRYSTPPPSLIVCVSLCISIPYYCFLGLLMAINSVSDRSNQ